MTTTETFFLSWALIATLLFIPNWFMSDIRKHQLNRLQNEAVAKGYAEWVYADDTYDIKEFKFKEVK